MLKLVIVNNSECCLANQVPAFYKELQFLEVLSWIWSMEDQQVVLTN